MNSPLRRLGVSAAALMAVSAADASLITNGDFQSGDLSGWTVFSDPAGSPGGTPVS